MWLIRPFLSVLTVSFSTIYAFGRLDSLPLSMLDKQLEEVVITGLSKATGLSNSILPIKVLNLEKLKTLGIQSAADALKFSANIRFSEDNILGSAISMQGLSGENVKILINGVPQNGRMNGNFDLSQINIAHVERIEIIEGPTSVLFGTNALAGTINIILKKNLAQRVGFQGSIYYESPTRVNVNAAMSFMNDAQSLMLSGGRNFFGGWSATETGRFQDWKPKIQYFTNGQYQLNVGKAQLSYQLNLLDEFILNRGRSMMPYQETAFDDTYKTKRVNNVVSWQQAFDNQAFVSNFFLSHSLFERTKNTYFRDLVTATQVLTDNAADQDTSRFDLVTARGTFSSLNRKTLNFEAGFDLNQEQGAGERLENGRQKIGDYALFASAEWKITEGVTLKPGVRLTHNTSYKAPIVPNLNVLAKLNPFWILRASYGRGFRAPNLKELYLYFVDINHNIQGNPNLKAETSQSLNIFLNQKKALSEKKVFKLESSVFYNDVNNLIALSAVNKPIGNSTSEFTYVNINRVRTLGGQFFAEYVYDALSLGIGGGYTRLKNQFEGEKEQTFDGETWETRANIAYFLKPLGLSLNAWYKHTGRQTAYAQSDEGKVLPTFLSGFDMMDIGLEKKMFKHRIIFSTGIKNLFNVKNIQSQLVSGAHGSGNGTSPLATGRIFFIKSEISL